MSLMAVMEAMGTSNITIVAAFFIGLMTAISPCPLATNITAIAYVSKRINNSRHTILVGFLYTMGRMFTYVSLASLIVWFGLSTQIISLPLQKWGGALLGPLLLIIGIIMLDVINLNFLKSDNRLSRLKERLANRGFILLASALTLIVAVSYSHLISLAVGPLTTSSENGGMTNPRLS